MKQDTYTLKIPQIKLFGYHGCYDKEKKEGQEFEVSVEILFDREYMRDINDSCDYVEIEEKIRSTFKEKRCDILEEVARNIGNELRIYEPQVELVKVIIRKQELLSENKSWS